MILARATCRARPALRLLKRLHEDQSALALIEFALVAPFFMAIGLLGADTANYALVHMKVSQMAMHVADNASRVGEQNVIVSRRVYEDDINDLFIGVQRFSGKLNIAAKGRIILSSLERNAEGGQWIHWQRCYGAKNHASSYGVAGNGATGTSFQGMGPAGKKITASANEAVMFAEIAYDYTSISPYSPLNGEELVYTAAFNVRDARDLSGIYQTNPAAPVATCQ